MTIKDPAFASALEATLNRLPRQGLCVELLESTPDEDLTELVFNCLSDLWERKYGYDTDRLLASLPAGARCLYLTSMVEGQVLNGGYAQLYKNGYGRHAEDFVHAFDYFSAVKYASLMREANKVYRKNRLLIWIFSGRTGYFLLHLFQRNLLPSKLPELEDLDDQFYAVEGELDAFRIAKIRSDPGSFVPAGV